MSSAKSRKAKTPVRTAMVLAAGLGTRMRPLTDDRPKPLVEVAQRPLIDHVLDRVLDAGIEEVVVNVHYKGDMLRAHLDGHPDFDGRLTIHISDETDMLLDTGGGVKKALPLLGDDPFLVLNSDSIWLEGLRPNLPRLIDSFDAKTMDAALLLAAQISSSGYDGKGDFLLDKLGRISRREVRQVAPFVYTGVQVIRPQMFEDTPDGHFSANLLFDRAIEAERLYGVRLEGQWMHVGTPEGRDDAERRLAGLHRLAS